MTDPLAMAKPVPTSLDRRSPRSERRPSSNLIMARHLPLVAGRQAGKFWSHRTKATLPSPPPYTTLAIFPLVNCVSLASAFRHRGQCGTAGHGSARHCPAMAIKAKTKEKSLMYIEGNKTTKKREKENVQMEWTDECLDL